MTKRERAVRVPLAKRIRTISKRHHLWSEWPDWVAMSARAISNTYEHRIALRETREARYMTIVGKYDADEARGMAEALGEVVLEMHGDPHDILGATFHDLELHNKWAGQFFTPQSLADVMAALTLSSKTGPNITWSDPAIGSGVLALGALRAMLPEDRHRLTVFGQDIDPLAIHMAYIQLSLAGVAATLVCGDTLRAPATEAVYADRGERPEAVWHTPQRVAQFAVRVAAAQHTEAVL